MYLAKACLDLRRLLQSWALTFPKFRSIHKHVHKWKFICKSFTPIRNNQPQDWAPWNYTSYFNITWKGNSNIRPLFPFALVIINPLESHSYACLIFSPSVGNSVICLLTFKNTVHYMCVCVYFSTCKLIHLYLCSQVMDFTWKYLIKLFLFISASHAHMTGTLVSLVCLSLEQKW